MSQAVPHRSVASLTAVLLAAALALTVCLAAAPVASATVTPRQVDAFLLLHASPLAGEGAEFCAAGERNGVDPAFLVAISGAESSFGEYLYSAGSHNAFNWFYAPTRAGSTFTGWDQAIDTVAAGLRGSLYYGAGRYSVGAIAPVYCPQGTQAWIANVTAYLLELGGDPSDTRWRGVAPVAAGEPAEGEPLQAAGVSSGLVALRPFTVVPRDDVVGARLRLRFTLVNEGRKGGVWNGVVLRLEGPSGLTLALGTRTPLHLAAGASYAFAATVRLRVAGVWRGWVSVEGRDGTVFSDAGPAVRVAVAPAPPKRRPTGGAAKTDSHRQAGS